MDETAVRASDIWPKSIYEFGPLVIDYINNQAYVNNKSLALTEDELNTLYYLAQCEGENITFERLYETTWDLYDGSDRRVEAMAGIDNVVKRLNGLGKDIVHIEILPESGYVFRLKRWDINMLIKNTKESV